MTRAIGKLQELLDINTTQVASLNEGILSIPFTHRDRNYIVRLKYKNRNARVQKTYYGVKDGVRTDLKHHPGLLIGLTPADLDYDKIEIDCGDDGCKTIARDEIVI